jgi:hypothetical protein
MGNNNYQDHLGQGHDPNKQEIGARYLFYLFVAFIIFTIGYYILSP